MKFMGDYPLKGLSEQDVITTILKVYINELVLNNDERIIKITLPS